MIEVIQPGAAGQLTHLFEGFHKVYLDNVGADYERAFGNRYDEGHCVSTLNKLVEAGTAILLACRPAPDVAYNGFICALVSPDIFGGNVCCTEVAWYCEPDARNSRDGLELVRILEIVAKSRGAQEIYMAHMADETGQRVAKALCRRGYTPAETMFVKRLED
jgi:hypothetical protein